MPNAQLTWIEDMQFVARADTGHAIVMDATEANGGFGSASGPMEVLLMGVLGCTAMDVISILKKKRQPVVGFKILATGERRRASQSLHRHPPRIRRLRRSEPRGPHRARGSAFGREVFASALATVRGAGENHQQHPRGAGNAVGAGLIVR